MWGGGGQHCIFVILAFDCQRSEIFPEETIVDVSEVNQRRCLEESVQWLENVDRTHLILASGKLVQLKSLILSVCLI